MGIPRRAESIGRPYCGSIVLIIRKLKDKNKEKTNKKATKKSPAQYSAPELSLGTSLITSQRLDRENLVTIKMKFIKKNQLYSRSFDTGIQQH